MHEEPHFPPGASPPLLCYGGATDEKTKKKQKKWANLESRQRSHEPPSSAGLELLVTRADLMDRGYRFSSNCAKRFVLSLYIVYSLHCLRLTPLPAMELLSIQFHFNCFVFFVFCFFLPGLSDLLKSRPTR